MYPSLIVHNISRILQITNSCRKQWIRVPVPLKSRGLSWSPIMSQADESQRNQPSMSQTLLAGRVDAYDGIILDNPDEFPRSPSEFSSILQDSLVEWKNKGRRGIWLKVPIGMSELIQPSVVAGFEFHHAEPDYVMLTKWLPDTENKLPPSASHQVGVGAFVYDKESNKVLLVKEKSGPLRGKDVWKLPTGLVLQGEDITEAAVREVEEETGVKAKFGAVLAMRQAHGFAFGKSDLFFLLALNPEAENAASLPLLPQEDEIADATWMPLEDYINIPFTTSRPLLAKLAERCVAWVQGRYKGLDGSKIQSGFTDRSDLLFFGESEDVMGRAEDAWMGVE